ncbi:hypothetical protein Y032_0031g2321 [Ancylostoma ceylanicum]|nr:hypothetical protein Y032_0031g2321 [Ancylostoma ceylanicum]
MNSFLRYSKDEKADVYCTELSAYNAFVRVLHRNLTRTLEREIMEAREIRRHEPKINTREELSDVPRLIS